MSPWVLRLAALTWHGRVLGIWTGWLYDLAKSAAGACFAVAAALAFTARGRRFALALGDPKSVLQERCRAAAPALFAGAALLLAALKAAQYSCLQGTMDSAMNLSAVWNVGRGGLMPDPVLGVDFLAEHFRPIVAVYTPLARLSGSPFLVVLLHSLFVLGGLWAFWRLCARFALAPALRLLLCAALASNYYFHENLAPWFYPESLAIPVYFLALTAWEDRARVPFAALACALLCVKEEAGLALFALGLASALTRERRRAGLALMAAAAAAEGFALWSVARWRGYTLALKWATFGWGRGPADSLLFAAAHPLSLLAQWAWPPGRFAPLLRLLLSAGGLAVFDWPSLAALVVHGAPHQMVAADGLASGFHTLVSHYGAFLLPLLFWGSGRGLSNAWRRHPRHRPALAAALLACAANGCLSSSDYVLFNRLSSERLRAGWESIAAVGPEERLWTQEAFAPALAFRDELKVFSGFDAPSMTSGYFTPDAVLLDAAYIAALAPEDRRRLSELLAKGRYSAVREDHGLLLWSRAAR